MDNIEKDVMNLKEKQRSHRIMKSVEEDAAQVADIAGRYGFGPSTVNEHRESLVPASEAEKIKSAYEKKIRALEVENEILRKAIRGISDIER